LTYPSEKYDFVSWDDDIPNKWKKKSHVPNHQPGMDDVMFFDQVELETCCFGVVRWCDY
jgi:hypothetical protein